MSNYYELIQNISKIKLGKAPTTFVSTTNKRYDKVKNAIVNSVEDYFLSGQHNFRTKKQFLNTIIGSAKYPHIYGMISDTGLTIDKTSLTYNADPDKIILNTTVTGKPSEYTIFDDKIVLYPIPNAVYNIQVVSKTDKYVKEIHLTDATSNSGQAKVYLTDTTGLVANDVIFIGTNSSLEEIGTILSVTTNDYVTLTTNLINIHLAGFRVEKYKYSFDYEKDEPNFPSRYHKILEYSALRQLYFSNAPKLAKYNELYLNLLRDIDVENRGTSNNKPRFIIKDY